MHGKIYIIYVYIYIYIYTYIICTSRKKKKHFINVGKKFNVALKSIEA